MLRFMFRAIGFLITLWGLSHFFSNAFSALDSAATQSFKMVETAAQVTQSKLEETL